MSLRFGIRLISTWKIGRALIHFGNTGRGGAPKSRNTQIKPFVIGRKNRLFANTPRGARTSATIYSLVETAKENDLNPFSYLKHLFERLPATDPADVAAIDNLLPWSESVQSAVKA